jgi:hypothetical protein
VLVLRCSPPTLFNDWAGLKKDELVKRDAVLVNGKINAGNMPECLN